LLIYILYTFSQFWSFLFFYCIGCKYTLPNLIILDKNILTLLKYIDFLLLSGLFLLLLLLCLFNALNATVHVYLNFFKHFFTLLTVNYTVQLSKACYFIFNAINKVINYNTTFDPKFLYKLVKTKNPKKILMRALISKACVFLKYNFACNNCNNILVFDFLALLFCTHLAVEVMH
jgi:hypothetical protein